FGFANNDDVLDRRNSCNDFTRQRTVVEIVVALGDHIGGSFRLLREVDDLGQTMGRQGVDGNETGDEQAANDREEFRDIAKLDNNAVARLKAKREEAGSIGFGLGEKLAIGPAGAIAAGDGDAVGMLGSTLAQEARKGLTAPVAAFAIKPCQFVRPNLL